MMLCQLSMAQLKAPFWTYDHQNDQAYQRRWSNFTPEKLDPDALQEWIEDARVHKDWEQVIDLVEFKASKDMGFQDYFLLGAAHGFRSREVARMMSLPYVRSMKINFQKAHELNPTDISTLVALYKIYSDLPSFLGGSQAEALSYVEALKSLDSAEYQLGLLYVQEVFSSKVSSQAVAQLINSLYPASEDCDSFPVSAPKRRRNFTVDLLRLAAVYGTDGACTEPLIRYGIASHTPQDSYALAWIYLYASKIYLAKGAIDQAEKYLIRAFQEDDNLEAAKDLQKEINTIKTEYLWNI